MYRGITPPLLGVTPIFAVSFWVRHILLRISNTDHAHEITKQGYDLGQKIIKAATPDRTDPTLTTTEYAIAGFISAIPQTFVAAPVERAKVLLQVQGQGGAEQKYKGVFDVVRVLYREGGVRSIFRGTGATLARDGPGSAAYVSV